MKTLTITRETTRKDIVKYVNKIIDNIEFDDVVNMLYKGTLDINDFSVDDNNCSMLINSNISIREKNKLIDTYYNIFINEKTKSDYEGDKYCYLRKSVRFIFNGFRAHLNNLLEINNIILTVELEHKKETDYIDFFNDKFCREVDIYDIIDYFNLKQKIHKKVICKIICHSS